MEKSKWETGELGDCVTFNYIEPEQLPGDQIRDCGELLKSLPDYSRPWEQKREFDVNSYVTAVLTGVLLGTIAFCALLFLLFWIFR